MKIFKTCILVSKKGSQDIDVCGGKHFGALKLTLTYSAGDLPLGKKVDSFGVA